jgi:cutinase
MKSFFYLPAFLALSAARPTPETSEGLRFGSSQEARSSIFRNELVDGTDCPASILIFARGSLELDNMGSIVGPPLADGLENALGADSIWIQGVGGQYAANLEGNLAPDGAPSKAIAEMTSLLRLADSKCPGSKIVAGGYSQGAALAAAAIRDIGDNIRNKIVGTVLFGYTKNKQNNGQIINYPSDRLAVFCNEGDQVCEGTLIVVPVHLDYSGVAGGDAANFLVGKING